jgi:hypothetical protein
MLIEGVAGPLAVRRRMSALRFGDAMREPLLCGVAFGLAAIGALSSEPEIDDLSHASCRGVPGPTMPRQLRRYGGGVWRCGPAAIKMLLSN